MKKALFFLLSVLFLQAASGQVPARNSLFIPGFDGYLSLKCDLHMHTVFSDGQVWPDVRVSEAFSEGLDAISITDHVEWLPHKNDIPAAHNRPYEIAESKAQMADLILIRGAEITRGMPPGHLNAIFISDAEALVKDTYMDALLEAKKQGAFIFWNHPGWKPQAPDGIKWYDEHSELFKKGIIMGIEVVNSNEYYPEALKWCMDSSLTVMSNSDIHSPQEGNYTEHPYRHRPLTIVFAKERSQEGIKEALLAGRSVAWFEENVYGKENLLQNLALASLRMNDIHFSTDKSEFRKIINHSSFVFKLELDGQTYTLQPFGEIIIPGNAGSDWKFTIENFVSDRGPVPISL